MIYIIATPIGNMQDITLRALNILKKIKYIACEDTRVTFKLLKYFDIDATKKHMICYNKYSSNEKNIIDIIVKQKQEVALVSDAGTPLISDPGSKLIKMLNQKHIKIVPIPGCSALTTALSCIATEAKDVTFVGFLPNKISLREKYLKQYQNLNTTLVFFESKNKMNKLQQEISTYFPQQNCYICRELTKIYEEIISLKGKKIIDENIDDIKLKGEFVVVVDNNIVEQNQDVIYLKKQAQKLQQHYSKSEVSKIIATLYNVSRNHMYQILTENVNSNSNLEN